MLRLLEPRVEGDPAAIRMDGTIDDAWRHYRAGRVVVRTAARSDWHVQASYTRSHTDGTMTTGLHSNAGVRFLLNNNRTG